MKPGLPPLPMIGLDAITAFFGAEVTQKYSDGYYSQQLWDNAVEAAHITINQWYGQRAHLPRVRKKYHRQKRLLFRLKLS